MKSPPYVFIIWLASILQALSATAQEHHGPIPLRNQFPLTAAHLSLMPQSASVLRERSCDTAIAAVWSNSFIVKDAYEVDAEGVEVRPRITCGFAADTQVSLELPFSWFGGGVLDDVIDGWHRIWGFPRGNRGDRPSDSFVISGVTDDLAGFGLSQNGMWLGNPVLGLKTVLTRTATREVAVFSELSLPKLSSGRAHQGVDINLGGVVSTPFFWGALHFGGALFAYSSDSYLGIPLAPLHTEAFLSGERPLTSTLSLVATVLGSNRTVRSIPSFPEYWLYLDLGARISLSDLTSIVVAFRENPAPHNGTTDISFFAELTSRLK